MCNRRHLPLVKGSFLALIVSVSGAGFVLNSQQAAAQQQAKSTFPDVPQNYWARPFIQSLAEKDIVTGYPNGMFKPKQKVDRDEFAAMIRQAFDKAKIRNIPSGSGFKDVPQDNWAAPPVEEAYETGFMKDFPGNEFHPQQPMTKTQALVALMKGLDLNYDRPVAASQGAARVAPANQRRKTTRNRLVFPLASTVLMQPLLPVISTKQQQQPKPAKTVPATTTKSPVATSKISALQFLKSYYKDADLIPKNAVDAVAAATQANIVVNYPDARVLNPNELLSRGSATALIHQALVNQKQIEPLSDKNAVKYIPKTPRP
ncbi:S-layer homology domain-containing protein [Tychonema sp. LEGE 07199]|uniref:S-layer homology domain-containing protein n=1 Tax=unclassified Tychonema TaxID=2642144 RepID=UPI001882E395|nr:MULTISPECIES: S-layer homology domain-containing protein [unclassified Tychonema]MBE9124372.1 S-layer homology domain-containing protein [Tychonema sp. LEGE 07199]MBE9132354.1 S-layer homology domain-containing protein [Tychonema sp. LEGE 07196]